MKKTFQSILICTLLALSLPGCQYLKELFGPVLQHPQVSVKDVQVVSANFYELKIKIKFLIQNPNSFKLEFSDLNYDIALSKRRVLYGTFHEKIYLPPEDNTVVEVPLAIKNVDAVHVLSEVLRKHKPLRLELKGSVDFHSSFGAMTINFNHERDLFSGH